MLSFVNIAHCQPLYPQYYWDKLFIPVYLSVSYTSPQRHNAPKSFLCPVPFQYNSKNNSISITEPFPHYLVPHSHPFSLFGVFHTMGTWPCIARRGPRLMTGNSASPGIVDLLTKCNLCKKYRYFFFKNNRIKVVFVFYEPNTTAL